jgi:hypothetical protein
MNTSENQPQKQAQKQPENQAENQTPKAEENPPNQPPDSYPMPTSPGAPLGPDGPAPGLKPSELPKPKCEEIERQRKSMRLISVIAEQVEPLTEIEIFDLMSFEEVIGTGWASFVQVGLALGQVRDRRLYRETYPSFQEYCRSRWQYGRNYADRLVSAAQVFNRLVTKCRQRLPEHEGQVRPLVGLTTDQAKQVWETAVAKAGNRRITAIMVKRAMRDLQIGPPLQPVQAKARVNMAEHRRQIDMTIGELLLLASQKADHRLLTEKIEILNAHLQAALPPRKQSRKGRASR